MVQARRGIDRIKLARLKAAVTVRQEELRSHKQVCSQCHKDEGMPAKDCDDGWRIQKELQKAGNTLSVYIGVLPTAPLPGQGTLF